MIKKIKDKLINYSKIVNFKIIEEYTKETNIFEEYTLLESDYASLLILISNNLDKIIDNLNSINEDMYLRLLEMQHAGKILDAYIVILTEIKDEIKTFRIEQNRAVCRKYVVNNIEEVNKLSFLPLPKKDYEKFKEIHKKFMTEFLSIYTKYEKFID